MHNLPASCENIDNLRFVASVVASVNTDELICNLERNSDQILSGDKELSR
jgi:hypothetical protein